MRDSKNWLEGASYAVAEEKTVEYVVTNDVLKSRILNISESS